MFIIGPFEYSFKNNNKKVFTEEEFVIQENELVLITGNSGSGKSTFLQMLKGIVPRYTTGKFTGKILYNGKALDGHAFEENLKNIIYLFQNPFSQLIYPSVAEEFFFSMENFNFSKEQMDKKKEQLIRTFDVDAYSNKKTTELSHGECQRLVLASLLAIDPHVLLLDEPTAFLDPDARNEFYSWLKKIKGKQTIFVVDHHLNEILQMADQILKINKDGEIIKSSLINEKKSKSLENIYFKSIIGNEITQLSVDNICFHYHDQNQLLKNISFNMCSNDVLVFKGENGKGKSTLLKIMAGIIKPLSGKIEIHKNNQIILVKNHYKEIGFIFQNPESHFFYDTIEEELKSVANHPEFENLLKLFFYNIDLKKSPFLLSEGEKRRLSILMTVCLNKSILLYDEPTFGQDQESVFIISKMILYFKNMGKIQIIISHDEDFISSLNANVFEMVDGCLRGIN